MVNKLLDFNPIHSLSLYGISNHLLELINLYKINKFPKVLLLSGDKGIGKFTLSFHFVNYVLSVGSKDPYSINNFSINENNFYYKQILSKTCQNFIHISNNNKKTSIENIRDIKKSFNNTLLNSLPRFIIFDDVELLNINSANSLLKFIEEPSNVNYFILINNKQQDIIETVKSRSLETKIFLNQSKKNEIFKKLILKYNLDNHATHTYINIISPGMLIQYSEILRSLDLDISKSFYETTTNLLDNFKKSKNKIYLDCIEFILEIIFSKTIKNNNANFIALIDKKKYLMRLLYNYRTFNLSNNTILEYIKNSKDLYA